MKQEVKQLTQFSNSRSGSTLILVIVFATSTIMIMGALIALFIAQQRSIRAAVASEKAFHVAESGVNDYRWRLAHNPDDYAGLSGDVTTSSGSVVGHYTVTIEPPSAGQNIVTITSTGWVDEFPNHTRTIEVRYGQPSYAQYAFLTNSNVWFGESETVNGRLHSNGGIRIDGTVDSQATTIRETYTCGPEHGCSNEEKDGIWGAGQNPLLWDFPVADGVDFDVVTVDLDIMEDAAVAEGVDLGNSTGYGYHIVFQNDGTFDVYTVTQLSNPVWGHDGVQWTYESNTIQSETPEASYQNVAIPDNGIIFVSDQTWVSGEVNGRVTVAAANLPDGSGTPYDIIIADDISYYPDRTSGSVLGLIAQQDILVPLYSPANLTIDAALMAQNGHVFRYYYYPPYYPSDTIKTSIESYGTIITNTLWTWTWVDGTNTVTSGYQTTNTIYDPNLAYSPPPYFPTQDNYEFISWEELLPNE